MGLSKNILDNLQLYFNDRDIDPIEKPSTGVNIGSQNSTRECLTGVCTRPLKNVEGE
jgi:hypothetical protein